MKNLTDNLRRTEILLIKTLIILLPMHYLVFSILLKDVTFLKYWKDILIFSILGLQLYSRFAFKEKFKPNITIILILLFIFYEVICIFMADNITAALYMFRAYTEPLLIFFIFKNAKLSYEEVKKILHIAIVVTAVISLYGIFQALVLGHEFLKSIGYPYRENGRLATSFYLSGLGNFQRVAGTLVSPNIFAFYASLIAILSLNCINVFKNSKYYKYLITVILLAILLTFSRSCWLGLGVGMLLFFINSKDKKKFILKTLKYTGIVCILLVIFSLVARINIIDNFTHLVTSTFSLKDTSTLSHIDSLKESINIAENNLMGTGLGVNGPKASLFYTDYYLTESSFFLIFFEFGIIGFILYFSSYISLFYESFLGLRKSKNEEIKSIYISTMAITVFSFVAFLFLPYVQDMEIISFYFMISGLSANYAVKKKGLETE